jgi:hypothetical protein
MSNLFLMIDSQDGILIDRGGDQVYRKPFCAGVVLLFAVQATRGF